MLKTVGAYSPVPNKYRYRLLDNRDEFRDKVAKPLLEALSKHNDGHIPQCAETLAQFIPELFPDDPKVKTFEPPKAVPAT